MSLNQTPRLVLLGGGHAHLGVLRALAQARAAGRLPPVQLALVSPQAHQLYSGMMPGHLAGHYDFAQCVVPLAPQAQAAGARWWRTEALGLDAQARCLHLADGRQLAYDLLSIDTGSVAPHEPLPGADAHALQVRPMEAFVERIRALDDRVPGSVAVVGDGAAGFELMMALAWRWRAQPPQMHWICGAEGPLPRYAPGVRRAASASLARACVVVHRARVIELTAAGLRLTRLQGPGACARPEVEWLPADLSVLALGPAAPPWLRGSGLQLDAQGYVQTGPTLQSVSHPEVWAAGDVATRVDRDDPKSGVYAVRAGPALAANLLRALQGQPGQPHRPPRHTLNLLATGDRHAIAAWGPLWAQGPWVWRWKDRIDTRFVEGFARA